MQSNRFNRCLAVLISMGTIFSLAPMTQSQSIQTAPTQKHVLDNGLTVLVREDHSAPVVSVQAWVQAGSITEGAWMGAGLSHVLEHMLFKGTTTRGVAQIAQEIESKGGYINAYTSFEQTVYYVNIPGENWQTAVDVLADCMMNATIPEDELLKEKQVIHREMAMNDDNPDRRANRMLWSTAYNIHPYRHPVIGYREVYDRTTRDDVLNYYKRFYIPNNMMFVVVGNVNAGDVVARLRELTRDFKRAPLEPVFIPPEPAQLSARIRHENAETDLSRLYMAWHIPSVTHPDVYPLDVLAIVLGQGRSSRLYRELRQKQGLVHRISAGAYTPGQTGLFIIHAMTDPDKRDQAIAGIQAELNRIARQPVTDSELQKAIKISVGQFVDGLKTAEGQASDIGHNELLIGNPDFSIQYLENLRKVTVADIQRVISRYFTEPNMTVVSLNPAAAKTGSTNGVAQSAKIEIQKFTLSNGIRLLVREDPKLPYVDIGALFQGGVLAETPGNNGITKLTARMLLKGTTTRSADQIADEIESVGGSISHFSGNNSFGITASSLSDDTPLALALVADVLIHPTFPDDMLTRERDAQLAEIKAEQDQIMRVAQQALRESLYQRHPYRLGQNGTETAVRQLKREDLAAFHRQYVTGPNMVLTVFGHVKADVIRQKAEELFGRIPTTKPVFPDLTPETLANATRQRVVQPREQAVLLMGFSGADMFNPDRYALELLSEAWSGQGSRLFLRVRDELGLAYYVGAYGLIGLQPGYFVMYVGTAPEQAGACEKEFRAEIEKLGRDGLSADELERARAGFLGQRKVKMQDNSDLAMTVGLDELYGLGHNFFQTIEERYRAVTIEDIKRVAHRYLAGKPEAVVVVGPEQTR